MDKDSIQNTSELKVSNIKNAAESTDSDEFKDAKKQNIAAIIVCVIIAFIIWLIIMNNTAEHIPTPLPEYGNNVVARLVE